MLATLFFAHADAALRQDERGAPTLLLPALLIDVIRRDIAAEYLQHDAYAIMMRCRHRRAAMIRARPPSVVIVNIPQFRHGAAITMLFVALLSRCCSPYAGYIMPPMLMMFDLPHMLAMPLPFSPVVISAVC